MQHNPQLRALALLLLLAGCTALQSWKFVLRGGSRHLRERSETAPQSSPTHAGLLVLALDGVDRALLYEMLRAGELPALATLLADEGDFRFPHAYFADRMLSTLPSSTLAAWVTAFTGVPPAMHGVSGNEFFIRDQRRLAAPAPVSFVVFVSLLRSSIPLHRLPALLAAREIHPTRHLLPARQRHVLTYVAT